MINPVESFRGVICPCSVSVMVGETCSLPDNCCSKLGSPKGGLETLEPVEACDLDRDG